MACKAVDPQMNRVHKSDPKQPPHVLDKRSVVPIEFEDVERWLFGSVEEASRWVRLASLETFTGGRSRRVNVRSAYVALSLLREPLTRCRAWPRLELAASHGLLLFKRPGQ